MSVIMPEKAQVFTQQRKSTCGTVTGLCRIRSPTEILHAQHTLSLLWARAQVHMKFDLIWCDWRLLSNKRTPNVYKESKGHPSKYSGAALIKQRSTCFKSNKSNKHKHKRLRSQPNEKSGRKFKTQNFHWKLDFRQSVKFTETASWEG